MKRRRPLVNCSPSVSPSLHMPQGPCAGLTSEVRRGVLDVDLRICCEMPATTNRALLCLCPDHDHGPHHVKTKKLLRPLSTSHVPYPFALDPSSAPALVIPPASPSRSDLTIPTAAEFARTLSSRATSPPPLHFTTSSPWAPDCYIARPLPPIPNLAPPRPSAHHDDLRRLSVSSLRLPLPPAAPQPAN